MTHASQLPTSKKPLAEAAVKRDYAGEHEDSKPGYNDNLGQEDSDHDYACSPETQAYTGNEEEPSKLGDGGNPRQLHDIIDEEIGEHIKTPYKQWAEEGLLDDSLRDPYSEGTFTALGTPNTTETETVNTSILVALLALKHC